MRAMLTALLFAVALPAFAQQPPNCAVGGFVISPDETIWVCKGAGLSPAQLQTSGSSIPAGSILLIDSGSCPAGFTEVADLNGRTLIGTLAASGNVGTTGGADTITPQGVNSGAAVADHPSHTHTYNQVISHTHAVTSVGSAATGGTTNLTGASDTSSTTATAAAPAGAVATGTTAGPSATLTHSVTQPTFTGTPGDNRSAFTRVIFCRKT